LGQVHRQTQAAPGPLVLQAGASGIGADFDQPVRGSLNGSAAAEHAPRWRNRDRSFPWARGQIFALALAGFVISLLAFWPGLMEFDSFDQYAQAIGKEQLNDWHPVILVFVWKLLIFVHDGPQLMLLLQLLLYWSGFLYLALHLLQRDKPWLGVAAILVAFSPFLVNFAGVLWKDTQLALAFFWAALLLAFAPRNLTTAVTSLALISYGLAVRHNGITAALPLLILWSNEFAVPLHRGNRFGALFCATSLAATLFLINFVVSEAVIVERTSQLRHQMLNEIAFIQCHANSPSSLSNFFDSYGGVALQAMMNEQERQTALCGQVEALASSGDTDDIFEKKLIKNPSNNDPDLVPLWLENVSQNPLAYLQYRLKVFNAFLRAVGYSQPYYVFCDAAEPNPFPERFSSAPANPFGLSTFLTSYIVVAAKWLDLFFRPFFWLITLTATAALWPWTRNATASLVCLSGLFYLGAYLVALPAPDFRYGYWAIFAQILSGLLLLSGPPRRTT
jgi:hypothetical protein